MPKRQMLLHAMVSRWVLMKAAIGAANAIPVSTPIGTDHTIPGVAAAPNSTMTSAKIEPTIAAWVAPQASWPKAIARGVSGVAYMA